MASFFKNHHSGCVYMPPQQHDQRHTHKSRSKRDGKRRVNMQASEHSFSYVDNTTDIISELKHSKEHGNVLGICAISLGPNMIMAAVDDIMEIKNDLLIILKETDLLGMKLPEEKIFLSEIVRVHPFRTKFNDPFHVKLRELRTRAGAENISA